MDSEDKYIYNLEAWAVLFFSFLCLLNYVHNCGCSPCFYDPTQTSEQLTSIVVVVVFLCIRIELDII